MAAVLLVTVFLTRGFFLEGQPHLVRIPALLVILGSGVFTYFTASQVLRAMTLGDLRIMFRRIT
jgi:flagellar motor component MotA